MAASSPGMSSCARAAVYPGLAAGRYVVWRHMDTPVGEVTIDGGRVTRFRWPD
jgi:hypothetical protein